MDALDAIHSAADVHVQTDCTGIRHVDRRRNAGRHGHRTRQRLSLTLRYRARHSEGEAHEERVRGEDILQVYWGITTVRFYTQLCPFETTGLPRQFMLLRQIAESFEVQVPAPEE